MNSYQKYKNIPVVVVTPIRNDAWILEEFIKVTTHFADKIVILDQASYDNSRKICKRYEKVDYHYIEREEFSADKRRSFLINRARDLYPGKKLLMGVDVDEFIAGNALDSNDWKEIFNSEEGTMIAFEKPDLTECMSQCLFYENKPFTMAYIDDGYEYKPEKIHCIRIPSPTNGKKLICNHIKFLHFSMVRPGIMEAKSRFYAVTETLIKPTIWNAIRLNFVYPLNYDYLEGQDVRKIPQRWLGNWEKKGIKLEKIKNEEFYWYDFEVLKLFHKNNLRTFQFNNIWNIDWEKCLQRAKEIPDLKTIPESLDKIGVHIILSRKILNGIYFILIKLKRLIF